MRIPLPAKQNATSLSIFLLAVAVVIPRARRILIQVGFFVLAGVLLYLALRGVNFSEMGEALRQANYGWIVPLLFMI